MRDGARIQASIELVERIDTSLETGGRAADSLIATYLKSRRYIGSKDRREIQRHVYDVLRNRGLLFWALENAGAALSARAMMAAKLVLLDGVSSSELEEMFTGGYAPEGLSL
ncbi:MAG: RsmB/NOP family class I SAM-dependent RNA methyltransferase, partial [Alphaproteobacteria bacterium]|nr:RsmB/NOP family class I SAM-dependent RNA methyltransferase [Alphaproteobacteria bacterium]